MEMKMKSDSKWWEDNRGVMRHLGETFAEEHIPVVLKALMDRTCAVQGHMQGTPKFGVDEFLNKLRGMGVLVYYRHMISAHAGGIHAAGNGELISWTTGPKGDVTLSWVASSEVLGEEIRAVVAEWLEPAPPAVVVPPVYGFSFEHGQYVVREIGHLSDTFTPENYTPDVAMKYGRIVTELNKPEPAGRLVLVEGEPGTGKTRMIRALIGSLMGSSKCIVVPPSLMDRLSGPEFTLCLIHQRVAGKPLTLILEDADDCLIARENNTAAKASLSALLNLSDGIMGATLDLRVVATTNQELKAIDRAILRPGRLLERVHVGALPPAQASEVFLRLSEGRTKTYEAPTALAQVYEDVRSAQA